MKKIAIVATIAGTFTFIASAVAFTSTHEGLVEYIGAQKNIFITGRADPTVPVSAMAKDATYYGAAAAAGLDGEITVFAGKPYVSKVRESGVTLGDGTGDTAVFGVWTQQARWMDEPIPTTVKNYIDLQTFVRSWAQAAGIDVSKPFPFRVSGTPIEVNWHINVNLTEGKPITKELFAKSKANYVAKNRPMNIVGFYSDKHPGDFISEYAPAFKPGGTEKNAMHVHFVALDGKSSGHIDTITLGPGMTLYLPQR